MIIQIKTSDEKDHIFKSSGTEPLQHYKYDKELHALLIEAGNAQYCFPLEHIIKSKIVK